jgi:hypothetical protein
MNVNHSLFTLALISFPLMSMDKEPIKTGYKREQYRKLFTLIKPKELEKLASQPFIPAAPKTYFHFTPIVGNGIHTPGDEFWSRPVGSQEVELGTNFLWKSAPETPVDVLTDRIRYLPEDIKARAFAHFAQKDDLLKGRITIDDAAQLAKLYQHEANERFKKEKPSEKTDEKKD